MKGYCNGMKLLQVLAGGKRASLRLCPVFFDGRLLFRGEEPVDAARRIDRLLEPVQPPALEPAF